MNIDRLLARFSIQTKVVLLVIPLIAGMAGLAAVNLYTGNLLGDRLTGTSASIDTLSGFKATYSGMTEFLQDKNEDKRTAVMASLDEQLQRMERVLKFADNPREAEDLKRSRQLAADLRSDVDALWALNSEITATRAGFEEIFTQLDAIRARLNDHIETVSADLAAAEEATKSKLRAADKLASGATGVIEISSAISSAATPEEVFKVAGDLKSSIRRLGRDLPKVIPVTKPALKSLIADNMDGLLATLKKGATGQAGKIELQKYANALRPTGIKLQGLASQVARDATATFAELDKSIVENQQTITDSRVFMAQMTDLELVLIEFIGMPNQANAEEVAGKLSTLNQSSDLIAFSPGGEKIMEIIGTQWNATPVKIPAMMVDLITKRKTEAALFTEASQRIEQAWTKVLDFANSQQRGTEAVKDRAGGITLYAAVGIGAFGLLAAFMLISALKGPILRLVSAMRDVASGDLDVNVTDSARADEIGEMARALDVFKMNAVDKVRVEDESARARQQAEQLRAQSDAEKAEAEAQLRFAIQSLGQALRNLSQGDLASKIDTPFTGELDALRIDFNESVDRMHDALHNIRDNASSIQSGSYQLRTAADDLARRTEQQAASLEQTAAAVEEISEAVRTASKRASETDELAVETSKDAKASGQIVSRAVEAMSRIEEASGKINQIIGVIDEIAFQTNLLALNAGVEAARAGEAGKGFAVVAQEVRELAGRSATAAREIKELISQSGEEVRSGVSLVGETGESIIRIISRIEDISGHVSAMATASREQATSLTEVNGAVGRMDQMTQQNAAMVEETNAASHSLAQDAAVLNELVAAFRLEAQSTHHQEQYQAA